MYWAVLFISRRFFFIFRFVSSLLRTWRLNCVRWMDGVRLLPNGKWTVQSLRVTGLETTLFVVHHSVIIAFSQYQTDWAKKHVFGHWSPWFLQFFQFFFCQVYNFNLLKMKEDMGTMRAFCFDSLPVPRLHVAPQRCREPQTDHLFN